MAGVDAGFLDVLHDAPDHHILAVRECVHVNFNRVFQKFVDEDRPVLRILNGLLHVLLNRVFFVGDDHGPPSDYIRRTNQHRESNLFAASTASSTEATMAPGACGISSSSSSLPKRLRSSARSIDSGVVPMILTPAALSGKERFSGV